MPHKDPVVRRAYHNAYKKSKRAARRPETLARLAAARAEYRAKHALDRIARGMRSNAKQRAKQRGVPFSLSLADVVRMLTNDAGCPYCEHKIALPVGGPPGEYTVSLDARVPECGYTQSNTVLCCWTCNRAKGDLPEEDFLRHFGLGNRRIALAAA